MARDNGDAQCNPGDDSGDCSCSRRAAEGKISPFNDVVYVQVTDPLASCKQAAELGATVVPGFPFNLSDGRGAIALITDPSGHPVGMYSKTLLPETPAKPAN